MLAEYGMECVWCVNFYDLFDEYAHDDKYMDLAFKMKAFDRDTVVPSHNNNNYYYLALVVYIHI